MTLASANTGGTWHGAAQKRKTKSARFGVSVSTARVSSHTDGFNKNLEALLLTPTI